MEGDRIQPDLEIGEYDVSSRKGRVSDHIHFARWGEPTYVEFGMPCAMARICSRNKKHRFRLVQLTRDGLHDLYRQPLIQWANASRVSAERTV